MPARQVFARQDQLPGEERGEGDRFSGDESGCGGHRRFGGEHRPAPRYSGECSADHAGRVLGGDRERSEDAERELDNEQSGQACLDGVEGGPVEVAGLDGGGREYADGDGDGR